MMNSPLTLLICDDEPLARQRTRALLQEIADAVPTHIVAEATNGHEALVRIEELRPQVTLLDIRMPGVDGLEVARHAMRLHPHAPAVIFLTAHDEFAVHAFEVQAVDYLLKPVRATRLLDALLRVRKRLVGPGNTPSPLEMADSLARAAAAAHLSRKHLSVIERGKLLLVPVLDVLYFKAEMKYVTIKTREREYVIEETLNSLEKEFGELFLRVHRNSLVARYAIAGVEKNHRAETDSDADSPYRVLLRGVPDTLPVSRRQWSAVKEAIRAVL